MADKKVFEKPARSASLFACYGRVYAWNADEIFTLRSKHRIVGSLIGSLPRKPRQNNVFSLPLLLSREEATLLLDKGFAQIYDMPKTLPTPCNEEVERFNELRQGSILKQIEVFQMMQKEKRMELADVIEEGRRRKRKKNASVVVNEIDEHRITDGGNEMDSTPNGKHQGRKKRKRKCRTEVASVGEEEENLLSKKMKNEAKNGGVFVQNSQKVQDNGSDKFTDHCDVNVNYKKSSDSGVIEDNTETFETIMSNDSIPTVEPEPKNSDAVKADVETLSTSSEDGKSNSEHSEHGTLIHIPSTMPQRLTPAQQARWTYPQTDPERLRYKVFADLWEKGFYLTSGVNFGGDFLAYPGDPSRYHSFYVVIIIPWERKITPFEIISAGRLGASVKKTALLCSMNEDTNKIVYTSVKWSGIS
ncbi:tRNA-splicing endonuclease subunit Sen34-like [Montipora foliosa]|uniref:tRNA-splicing endonuclease subunit Sen34-like n=1 Tax=Montipora foliosa TaxID=591990 RepID=UPI0035F1FA16